MEQYCWAGAGVDIGAFTMSSQTTALGRSGRVLGCRTPFSVIVWGYAIVLGHWRVTTVPRAVDELSLTLVPVLVGGGGQVLGDTGASGQPFLGPDRSLPWAWTEAFSGS